MRLRACVRNDIGDGAGLEASSLCQHHSRVTVQVKSGLEICNSETFRVSETESATNRESVTILPLLRMASPDQCGEHSSKPYFLQSANSVPSPKICCSQSMLTVAHETIGRTLNVVI